MDQPEEQTLTDSECGNYRDAFRRFLEEFTWQDDDAISQVSEGGGGGDPELVYVAKAQEMFQLDRTTMDVDYAHLIIFDPGLADMTRDHYFRLEPYLRRCCGYPCF